MNDQHYVVSMCRAIRECGDIFLRGEVAQDKEGKALLQAIAVGIGRESGRGQNMGSSIEQQLKEVYVPMLMQSGMPISQANEQFSEMLRKAKEESRKAKMDNLPQNFGDLLLQNEATAPNIKSRLEKVRREGVTDDDIRTWWNLHDLERRFMIMQDEISRAAVVMYELDKMGVTKNPPANVWTRRQLRHASISHFGAILMTALMFPVMIALYLKS